MPKNNYKYNEIKQKLRALKKLEMKLRPNMTELVWNEYFDVNDEPKRNAKYALANLYDMNKDQFKDVISQYFYHVYYCVYKESGFTDDSIFDTKILKQLGFPVYADYTDIKKKFRELAKTYHPDNGGDSAKFIEFMEEYKNCGFK